MPWSGCSQRQGNEDSGRLIAIPAALLEFSSMGIYVPNQRWACAPCWHRAQGKIHIYEHEQASEHAPHPLQKPCTPHNEPSYYAPDERALFSCFRTDDSGDIEREGIGVFDGTAGQGNSPSSESDPKTV